MDNKLLIDNFRIPNINNKNLIKFIVNKLDGNPKLLSKIPIIKKPNCFELKCHANVEKYQLLYGGYRIIGYYFIEDIQTSKIYGIKHSIWLNTFNELIDITPFSDSRTYNIFYPYQFAIDKIIL